MINLTEHFNAALGQTWHPAEVGYDLTGLPSEVRELQRVRFDIRGIVQVNGGGMIVMHGKAYPSQVEGIKVGRKCTRLHFLHASGVAVAEGTQIGTYVVDYADGQQREIRIVYGENVRDWDVLFNEPPAPEQLQVAWTGTNAAPARIRLFKTTWENPLPGLEITTIDYVSKMTPAAPFLIALTVE